MIMEHRYGMRLRGFSPACQPMEGLLRREDAASDKYYDILVYDRNLTYEEVKGYDLDALTWFAVQETSEDDWSYGSYNYDTAVKMLKEQGHGLIAVINEETSYCEQEIAYEDV